MFFREVYMTPERITALLRMGDYLDGIDDAREYNDRGFNKADKGRWKQSRGHYGAMHGCLVKYRRQLEAAFGPLYGEAGLSEPLTDQDVEAARDAREEKARALKVERDRAASACKVVPTLVGSQIYFKVEGRIGRADWDRYKEIQRGWGLRWDGVVQAWKVALTDLGRFRHDSYAGAMAEIGITVGPMPQVAAEVAQATRVARSYQLSIERDQDGRFVIRFPYHAGMVELFSNRSGQLTGITEYDPVARSRSTYSLELVEEIIEKVGTRFPDWGIEAVGVDEARRERDQRDEMLRRPIPAVAALLAPGYSLFPYQNEMVHFLDRCNGNALVGDEMGCIAGDAIVVVNRGGGARRMRLADLFYKFHGGASRGRSWDLSTPTMTSSVDAKGILTLNKIVNVIDKGEKPVLKIKIRAGRKQYTLICTPDHEILTPSGQWVAAEQLQVGATVMVNGQHFCSVCNEATEIVTYKYSKFLGHCKKCVYRLKRTNRWDGHVKTKTDKDGYCRTTKGVRNHPRWTTGGVYEHILVYEADRNGMSLAEWIKAIGTNCVADCYFVPADMHVHHKNKTKTDNRPSNLELLSWSDHGAEHADLTRIPHMAVKPGNVSSIEAAGSTRVFDLVMADPLRNFIANGVVVHNCGKTLQALAWAAQHGRRVLVVCPKVVRRTWIDEARKFFPGYFAEGLELRLKMLKAGVPDLGGFPIVTINYESLVKFETEIMAGKFDCIIIDESHRIKNPDAQVTQNVTRIAGTIPHRILLSGTAIKNKKVELHSQVELIDPGLLGTRHQLQGATIGGVWNTLRSRYLARQKRDVLKDLPELLTSITRLEVEGLPDLGDDDAVSDEFDVGQISRLKNQIAIGKATETIAFIRQLLDGGDDKVLVFSDSVEATKTIAAALGELAILHHGQMSDDRREDAKATFQREGGARVFCTTRQSLAVGATMTAASLVVFNDLPWTPADVRQAEGRAHRVGQRKTVNCYWLTAQDNLFDERVTEILKNKFDLSKRILEGKQLTPQEREWMERPISIAEIVRGLWRKR